MKRSLFIAYAPEILASVALLRFLFINGLFIKVLYRVILATENETT